MGEGAAAVDRSVAIVTPSYSGDLERCRLLCDSIDARVAGYTKHYILVADHDRALFRGFEGAHRTVLSESELLPERFLTLRPPGGRPLWLSTFAWPLRGWHVQQLRRMALPVVTGEAGYLYCDSDMAFVRPFEVGALWRGEAFRLYRNPNGIHRALANGGREHMGWTRHAHAILGLAEPGFPAADYINNLVSWRRSDVLAMHGRIEATTGRPWLRAVTAQRSFSECQIYGAYVDGVADPAAFWADETKLCRTFWDGAAMGAGELRDFVDRMAPEQVAIGVQSFTGTNPAEIRQALGL